MHRLSDPAQQHLAPYRFPTSPSSEEIASLLAAAGETPLAEDVRDVVTILLHTGMRPSELCELRWSDVDFEERSITINSPKTLRARRIPIAGKTIDVLRARRERQPSTDYVFGQRPRSVLNRVARRINLLCDRIGARRITLHSFRHAFAEWWCNSGGDCWLLASIMGFRLTHRNLINISHLYDSAARFQAQLEN